MAVAMVFAMFFSSFFIASHVDHDCTGEDCPICACIQQCENTIRGIGSGIAATSAVIMPLMIALVITSFGVLSFQWNTPVSAKVRMNN